MCHFFSVLAYCDAITYRSDELFWTTVLYILYILYKYALLPFYFTSFSFFYVFLEFIINVCHFIISVRIEGKIKRTNVLCWLCYNIGLLSRNKYMYLHIVLTMLVMCPSLRSVPKTRTDSSSVNAVMLWIHLVPQGPACLFFIFFKGQWGCVLVDWFVLIMNKRQFWLIIR